MNIKNVQKWAHAVYRYLLHGCGYILPSKLYIENIHWLDLNFSFFSLYSVIYLVFFKLQAVFAVDSFIFSQLDTDAFRYSCKKAVRNTMLSQCRSCCPNWKKILQSFLSRILLSREKKIIWQLKGVLTKAGIEVNGDEKWQTFFSWLLRPSYCIEVV